MKIVLDVSGGDNAPDEVLKGGYAALNVAGGFELVLCGDADYIGNSVKENRIPGDRIEILDAKEIITNDDIPTEAVRSKKNSSVVRAFDYLNENSDARAFVSAGSTGAVLTGAVLLLKRIKGINRPALSPLLPTIGGGKTLLIDCGANVEPKPINLLQFAKMGGAYMHCVEGIENPGIGLLSNGSEESKGNALNREAFPLLKNSDMNFIGNVEAREILSGKIDVVVADGYGGNIALKACEGTALALFDMIKTGIYSGGLRAKLGYLLLKPVFKDVKRRMDYNDYGGAVLLGLEKIVIKSHGSSKAKAICNSILQAKEAAESGLVSKIEEAVGK